MRTSASVNFRRAFLKPRACRPRSVISFAFSTALPTRRCLGFTHGGLSQEWRTNALSGTVSPSRSKATRCAFRLEPLTLTVPYPPELRLPDHSMQPDGTG